MQSRPKVIIDGYFWGKPYGFGRYVEELLHALAARPSGLDYLVLLPTTSSTSRPDTPVQPIHLAHTPFPVWEQVTVPLAARRLRSSLVHFPYNTSSSFLGAKSRVVTVHDLFFIDHPSSAGMKDRIYSAYSRAAFHLSTRKADVVVSVSDETARRLLREGVHSTVIPNTVDRFVARASAGQPAETSGSPPFFLHRGGYEPHRNTLPAMRAFLRFRQGRPEVRLRVLGAPDGAQVWGLGPQDGIDFLPRLSEAEVVSLYRSCLGLLAVSLREGFGLPILEGFGLGAPVIASARAPMSDVAGDAALLVDPLDEEMLVSAMEQVLLPGQRESLTEKGKTRFKDFDGDRFARAYVEVYERALRKEATGQA